MKRLSAELIGILVVGVGLAGLVYTGQASLKAQMDAMESRMDERMDAMESRMDAMESRMTSLEQRVARIEGLLEGMTIAGRGTLANPGNEKE